MLTAPSTRSLLMMGTDARDLLWSVPAITGILAFSKSAALFKIKGCRVFAIVSNCPPGLGGADGILSRLPCS
jgi:hypothetical protein